MWRALASPHDIITIELSRCCYPKTTAISGQECDGAASMTRRHRAVSYMDWY